MPHKLILASGSKVRENLLRQAGVAFDVAPVRVDEAAIAAALREDGASPRDIADQLAEAKARRGAQKNPSAMVIGCDQTLDCSDNLFSKPADPQEAHAQLIAMRARTHKLHAAAVIYLDGAPIWRHVATARLSMRDLSDHYIDSYIERNWQSIRHSVGAYKLEEEGVRLFEKIEGDYFTVLGIPLLPLLNFLMIRGELDG